MAEDKLKFQALLVANEQRSAYGLRYNDYPRYRKHCTNRTHRLRSSLKITHGKGKEFKKAPPVKSEDVTDGYLLLLLFEAERAWTYSRELSQQATANKEKSSALKRNATSRFRRAVNWATQLLSHSQTLYASSRLSTTGLIQTTIYTLILNGRFLSSRYDFEDALIQLSVARGLLDELASRASTSRDQALATSFADEIGPEIRYCAHELGRAKAYDIDSIVKEVSAKHKNEIVEGYDSLIQKLAKETSGGADSERKRLRPIDWEGEPVPVRNPELVDVLLKVQEAEDKLQETEGAGKHVGEAKDEEDRKKGRIGKGTRSKKGVAAYDAILLALSDAEEVARKLVEAHQASPGTSTTGPGTRDLQFVHAFIVYQLLSRRIQRDLLLITTLIHQSQATTHHHPHNKNKGGDARAGATSVNPRREQIDARLFPAVVKLLDTTLQSLTQMRALSVVDESPDLASAVEARTAFTKAKRCRYLARCYAPLKRYAESLTLIQHATIHLRETNSLLSLLSEDPINFDSQRSFYLLTPLTITALEEELSTDSLQFKKDWLTFNGGTLTTPTGPGSEVQQPKTFKKPLFYDIALNYIQLDMERLQERAGKAPEAPPKTSGVSPPLQPIQSGPVQKPAEAEKKPGVSLSKTVKVEEVSRPSTPEPSASAPVRSGLSSLLGGWWGRK